MENVDDDVDGADILADLLANEDNSDKEDENSRISPRSETKEEDPPLPGNKVPPSSLREAFKNVDFNFLDVATNVKDDKPSVSPTLDKCSKKKPGSGKASEVYDDTLDSSDDEDRRYFEQQSYSESGRSIKQLLKDRTEEKQRNQILEKPKEREKTFDTKKPKPSIDSGNSKSTIPKTDVYADPFFGLRIVKPLISSTELKDRMVGRTAVPISRVKAHIESENVHNDWVIAGVITSKSPPRVSQKGNQYCIWKLGDLSENMNNISLFLFSGAYKQLWKLTTGTAIGILNPNVLESKDQKDEAALSVDNPQKVMVLGQSKDMGTCRSMKKNGEPCTSVVNLSRCEYCIYHVKKEYNKFSRRADLQSLHSGKGSSLSNLGTKKSIPTVLQASMGLREFTVIPAKKNQKMYEKDRERLALLKGVSVPDKKPSIPPNPHTTEKKNKGFAVELTASQMKKDMERLNKLRGWTSTKSVVVESIMDSSSDALDRLNSEPMKSEDKPLETGDTMLEKFEKISDMSDPKLSLSNLSSQKSSSGKNSVRKPVGMLQRTIENPRSKAFSLNAIRNVQTPPAVRQKSLGSTSRTKETNSKKTDSTPRLGTGVVGGTVDFTDVETKRKSTSSLDLSKLSPGRNSGVVPRLGSGMVGGTIDFMEPITKNHVNRAKDNALKWVRRNGTIKKSNPNQIRPDKEEQQERGVKRQRELEEEENEKERKKRIDPTSEKFKELLEATSSHQDLLERANNAEQEAYFNKLEIKERMEEKMLTTYKVDCKAVRCLICKYTAFSSSDICKEQRHPLRVFDAVKRFFKCSGCGNRTVSLDRIPSLSCTKCGGSSWARAAMMDERRTEIAAASLCIRGDEEKFIGSTSKAANINLLVPSTE